MIDEKDLDAPLNGMRFQRGRSFASGSWPGGNDIASHTDRIHLALPESEGWNPLCRKREPPFGFDEIHGPRMHALLCEPCLAVCLCGLAAEGASEQTSAQHFEN
jgi:hypothetical protein